MLNQARMYEMQTRANACGILRGTPEVTQGSPVTVRQRMGYR